MLTKRFEIANVGVDAQLGSVNNDFRSSGTPFVQQQQCVPHSGQGLEVVSSIVDAQSRPAVQENHYVRSFANQAIKQAYVVGTGKVALAN